VREAYKTDDGPSACSGTVMVRPFQAKIDPGLGLEAEGLPVEAMKRKPDDDGNP